MGMTVYHKITTEITGPDGREWLVTVEPPVTRPLPGVPTLFEVEVKQILSRSELEARGGRDVEPQQYSVPSSEGIFQALNVALNCVPGGV